MVLIYRLYIIFFQHPGWTIMSWLRLSLLPATIYLIQNMCSLIAYQNLDAITYNVLNQTKTLSAALCCYFLMNKKQSLLQMLALLLLLTAALIMEKVVHLDMMLPSYWMNAHDGNNNATNNYSIMSNLSPRHLSWSYSNNDCLIPFGPGGSNHPKEFTGGESKCAFVHYRAMCCIHPYTIGIIRYE